MGVPSVDEVRDWPGSDVQDVDGTQLGRLVRVYVDSTAGKPAWLLLTSPTAGNSFFAPLRDATRKGALVTVAVPAPIVFSSPVLGTPVELGPEDEARLTRHYEAVARPSLSGRLVRMARGGPLRRLLHRG